ncbi:Scr1 family TA system antitoxin-like transcriptional regulator [Streptosporangium amethystogenes]|uniref:Scr1 family TA system antitoxin-like transcriptional regulator n=1 Tax=Streptosporangium amethystogenes TaxID=2002 RepID=UPI0037B09ADC
MDNCWTSLQEYQSEFVPGLLQTEGYARAVMRSAPVLPPDEEVERLRAVTWNS